MAPSAGSKHRLGEYLGQLLINFGHLDDEDLARAFAAQQETKVRLGQVLVQLGRVPANVVRAAIESTGAPDELDLLSSPFVAAELAYRIFGETPDDVEPVTRLSTWLVAGGVGAAVAVGALVCWLRYRRLEAFR